MEHQKTQFMGAGIAIGAGIGTALGVALDNIAFGVAFGVAFGIAFGSILSKKGENCQLSQPATRRLIFILLALGVFAGLAMILFALIKN